MKQMWFCPTCGKRRKSKIISMNRIEHFKNLTSSTEIDDYNLANEFILKCNKCCSKWETNKYETYDILLSLPNAQEILEEVKL